MTGELRFARSPWRNFVAVEFFVPSITGGFNVFKRLLSRLAGPSSESPSRVNAVPEIENLEGRLMLHSPTIQRAQADNRGESFIYVEASSKNDLDLTTINKSSIQMYTAGPDGHLGGVDDVKISVSIKYTSS